MYVCVCAVAAAVLVIQNTLGSLYWMRDKKKGNKKNYNSTII